MQKDSRKFGTLNYSPYLCRQKETAQERQMNSSLFCWLPLRTPIFNSSLFTLQYENREITTHSCRCLRQAMGGQGI